MIHWPEDILREFPIIKRTNRDAEIPLLLEYVKEHPVESLLDVGAHYSIHHYAPQLREMVKKYDAIDIIPDPETEAIVDSYIVGNANEITEVLPWEMVISVSVFEHCGLSTYTADHNTEVINLFKTCLRMASKYVWLSFDVGQPYVTPGQHAPITKDLWNQMLKLSKDYKVTKRFLYSQGPQANHPWIEHNKEDVAFNIPYIDFIGNQSIGVLEIIK